MLVMRVFYEDQLYEYSNTVINTKLSVHLAGGAFAPLRLLTLLMLVAGGCYLAYHVINRVVNRFFYPQGNKPHQPQFDLLDYVKGLTSKRE